MKKFISHSARQTKKIGSELASLARPGQIFALKGTLGTGKTTLAQGMLKRLQAKGRYTSPTFIVIKHYSGKIKSYKKTDKKQFKNRTISRNFSRLKNRSIDIYHIDAYRINSRELLKLGWKELISNRNNVIIVEWADRVKKIIPKKALWIKLEWIGEKERKIFLENKKG